MKLLLGLLSPLLFIGCVYPIYKTLQPESRVTVLDENKVAVQNVKVHLQSMECMPCKKSEQVNLSNYKGIVHFTSQKEWRKEILVIHGRKFFTWNWCIEKEGYKTILTSRESDKFESHRTFILEKGDTLACDSPYLLSEFQLKRFDDSRLKNRVDTLITEMLNPHNAINAYVKLEKLGKDAVPYIVLAMDDFRELPIKSILLDRETKVTVQQVTDVLSIILTKIIGQQFTPNFDEKSLDEKVSNIYQWRRWILNWGLSQKSKEERKCLKQ